MEFLLVYDFGAGSKHAFSDIIEGDNLETILQEWREKSYHSEYRVIGIIPINKKTSELSQDYKNMDNFNKGSRMIVELRDNIAKSCGSWE